MFVLAVGLLGVAALIPAGRSEIALGNRLENAAMIGRVAFRDLQIRDYLRPQAWPRDAVPNPAWDPFIRPPGWDPITNDPPYHPPFNSDGTSHTNAVVIDPLGIAAGYAPTCPRGVVSSEPHLARIVPYTGFTPELADLVCRASHDLVIEENGDLPPKQSWFVDGSLNSLRRSSEGNYSWLATVVIDPTVQVLDGAPGPVRRATVSVAVFHKRNLSEPGAGEYIALAMNSGGVGIGGGEVQLVDLGGGRPYRRVKPGEWLMLAARRVVDRSAEIPPLSNLTYDYYRWYRVVAASESPHTVTLAGADRDPALFAGGSNFTKAFIFDGIVAVYEKNLLLEIE